jgi:hypothetical protein
MKEERGQATLPHLETFKLIGLRDLKASHRPFSTKFNTHQHFVIAHVGKSRGREGWLAPAACEWLYEIK